MVLCSAALARRCPGRLPGLASLAASAVRWVALKTDHIASTYFPEPGAEGTRTSSELDRTEAPRDRRGRLWPGHIHRSHVRWPAMPFMHLEDAEKSAEMALNQISLHPPMLAIAAQLMETVPSDLRLSQSVLRARYGPPVDADGPGSHMVYGIVSDGDLMEGIAYEAASLAGHLGLGNLVYLYDDNKITIDGPTSVTFSEDVAARFEAVGWHVQTAAGEDLEALDQAITAAREETGKPSIIVMQTKIGHGAPTVEGKSKAHGAALGAEGVEAAKNNLGWPLEPTLHVPDEVRAYCSARAAEKREARAERDARFDRWAKDNVDPAQAYAAARARTSPADLIEQLADGAEGANATRNHSKAMLQKLSELVPYMVGGSADLAGSAAPPILSGTSIVGPGAGEGEDPFAGRNIHFGIREHAMGAITNGIALDGTFLPYSGTFLIFSDYMRPSIRLAALMGLRSIFVFTHDSIFVGEDGPTHQPIEQLDALRAIPKLKVFRPADGVETAAAYAWIVQQADGPAMLSLSRQKVEDLERPAGFALADVNRGAYTLVEPDRKPDLVVLASGTEVRLACDAADKLEPSGIAARVVSVPCLELFEAQDDAFIESLVPDDGTPIVAVEAARGESFRRLVGRKGLVYGIDRFGASAPHTVLATEFGYTPDALSERVRTFVGKA